MAIYEYWYKENWVCGECGKQNYHINLYFRMPKAKIYHDTECEVWCHNCETETYLAVEVEDELEEEGCIKLKQA